MNSFFNSTGLEEGSRSFSAPTELAAVQETSEQGETDPIRRDCLLHIQTANDAERKRQAAAFLRSQLDKPLEERLKDAGLLSNAQLILLRQDQHSQPELSAEEILRLRGWLQDTTLNFFMYLEQTVLPEFRNLSIGQRLKYAGLIDDEQLAMAMEYKRQTDIRLGHAIFLSGILSQTTVDYFVQFW